MKRLTMICIVAILLTTIVTQGGYLLYKYVLMEPYVQNETTVLDQKNTSSVARHKETLQNFQVDTSIPCVPGEGVVLTLQRDLKGVEMLQERSYPAGTTIELDFFNVPYGGVTRDTRRVEITIAGERFGDDVQVNPNALLHIYMDYIESKGLEQQFQEETGRRYSRSSARDALFIIDQRCYQQGVSSSGYYPINMAAADASMMTLLIVLPLIIIVFFITLDQFLTKRKQNQYWKEWYRYNKVRHDAVQLPQFHSLNGKMKR